MNKRKEDLVYVGIDLHKESHTAVILDCWNTKLGEITFANTPAEFPKLIRKVNKFCIKNKEAVYGLENAYGYGRGLAVWLIGKDLMVKDVNTSLAHRQAKCRAMYKKSDSDDAQAIALATINMLDSLPDACPNDAYWSLSQMVNRRDNIMTQRIRLKNQLHEQLCIACPSYKQFFEDISRKTALFFWEHYPSEKYLRGKTPESLAEEMKDVGHNSFSVRRCKIILDAVKSDHTKAKEYQNYRDVITMGLVKDLQHYDEQLKAVDKELEKLYHDLGCTLATMPGMNITTAVKIMSEIGDVNRFPNPAKLAQFAGIAPINLSSAGKGKDKASKQGNRRLQATLYFLAIQMIQVSTKGKPRNPIFRDYYDRKLAEGKNAKLVLVSKEPAEQGRRKPFSQSENSELPEDW